MLLTSLQALAQEFTVEAVVKSDNNPVKEAQVFFGNKAAHHEEGGRYKGIFPQGKHSVTIVAEGYETLKVFVQLASDTLFYFDLVSNAESLGEIVITGTSRPVQRLESPVAVEVYSPQFFKKNPSPSIFESLQQINGVRPQINCSVCNTGDIHINGLEGPYTMVTIDGMPVVSSLASVYGLFGIPSQLIERVEILKGPASGLYGSEAIGGLINIITKSPEKAPLLSVNTLSTNWNEHSLDLGLKWKAGASVQSLLGIHYFNFNHVVDKNKDGFTDVPLQNRISVFNKWSFKRKSGAAASFAARFFNEDRWGGETGWKKIHRGGDAFYGESIYTNRWEFIGVYQLPVKERILFNGSTTFHNQDAYYGEVYFKGKQDVAFGQFLWEKNLGARHSLLTGLVGRYNYYDDNSTATMDTLHSVNRPEKYFIPGLFLQEEWSVNSKQKILAGIRLDHHPVHKLIFTPRLAYKLSISKHQVIRLNAGTGFRVVNLFTEEHAALTGARAVEITTALKPEKSYNVNLNYNLQHTGRSLSWSMDASVWHTRFTNQIIPDYETHPNKIIYDNLDGFSISRGFSLNTEWNYLYRLKAMLGITLQDVFRKERNTDGKMIAHKPMFTESWSGTWLISYTIPLAGWSFDYTGNIYGPMQLPLLSALDPRKAVSPVWSIQNLQVTKGLGNKLELFTGIKNVLDWTPAKGQPFLIARAHDPFNKNVQFDAGGKPMATQENPYALSFDPTYIYAPNQGRRFFVGLRWVVRKGDRG